MADPQRHARVLINREPWSGRVLRQLTDAQTAHWRFRLFGPLTAPAARTLARPELAADDRRGRRADLRLTLEGPPNAPANPTKVAAGRR